MKCPSCGYENSQDARYCGMCQVSFAKANTEPERSDPLSGLRSEPSQEAKKVVQKILRSQPKGLNWFQRHLNWTWVLPQLVLFIVAMVVGYSIMMSAAGAMMSPTESSFMLPFTGLVLWFGLIIPLLMMAAQFGIGAWVLKRKGRSLRWLLVFLIPSGAYLLNAFLGFVATVVVWIVFLRLENRGELMVSPTAAPTVSPTAAPVETPKTSVETPRTSIGPGLAPDGLREPRSTDYGP